MTTFALIRHGVTSWNKEGRIQGHADSLLDEEGIQQAEWVAARLSNEAWDRIFSSDLIRAKRTAEIIGAKVDIDTIICDQRLREMSKGRVEGTTEAERLARWGPWWKKIDFGTEPVEEGMKRGSQCLHEIAQRHRGERIIVVSHGAIIRNILNKLIPDLDTGDRVDNTAVTLIEHTDAGWSCHVYNCTSHYSYQ